MFLIRLTFLKLQVALISIQQKLNDSVIFLDGEPINNPSETVDQFIKQKKSRDKDVNTCTVHGSIYYLCVSYETFSRSELLTKISH